MVKLAFNVMIILHNPENGVLGLHLFHFCSYQLSVVTNSFWQVGGVCVGGILPSFLNILL